MEKNYYDRKKLQEQKEKLEKKLSSIESEIAHLDLCLESSSYTEGEKAGFNQDYEKLTYEKQHILQLFHMILLKRLHLEMDWKFGIIIRKWKNFIRMKFARIIWVEQRE